MLYRILTAALLSAAPLSVLAATGPRVELAQELDTVVPAPLAAWIHAINLGGPAPSPFFLDGRNEMWDALGGGCVDAADPVAWLASGQRDASAGPICIPQPCARVLTEEEMARDVLGRPLGEGEWDTYTELQSRACATMVMWDGEPETAMDLLPYGGDWAEVAYAPNLAVNRAGGAATGRGGSGAGSFRMGHHGGGGGGGGGSGGSVSVLTGGSGPGVVTLALAGDRSSNPVGGSTGGSFRPRTPTGNGSPTGNGTPTGGGNPPPGGDGDPVVPVPAPSPVPLPGSFLLLAAAVGALRLSRR